MRRQAKSQLFMELHLLLPEVVCTSVRFDGQGGRSDSATGEQIWMKRIVVGQAGSAAKASEAPLTMQSVDCAGGSPAGSEETLRADGGHGRRDDSGGQNRSQSRSEIGRAHV